jgi:hypothetical protein
MLTKYWDGPNYLFVAKTLYKFPEQYALQSYGNTPKYFAAHLPLYPLLIRVFTVVFTFEQSMLFVSILSSTLFTLVFYLLVKELNLSKEPFWVALLSIFLPTRALLYRNLGATEGLFMLMVYASFFSFYKKRYFWAFILAGLSTITRIFGIFLLPVYLFELVRTRKWSKLWMLSFVLLPLVLTFLYYQSALGSFTAYFDINGKLIMSSPFYMLNLYSQTGVQHAAELYLLFYVVYGFGLLFVKYPENASENPFKNYKSVIFNFSLLYYLLMLFVYHMDMSRYFMPIAPMCILIPFGKLLERKYMKLSLLIIIPLLYIYSHGMIPTNVIDNATYTQLLNELK